MLVFTCQCCLIGTAKEYLADSFFKCDELYKRTSRHSINGGVSFRLIVAMKFEQVNFHWTGLTKAKID